MKTLALVMGLGAVLGTLRAETVRWTARGEVTGVVTAGAEGFLPLGIDNGQKVEVEIAYDDAAGREPISDFSGFGWYSEWDYPTGIGLEVGIRIGGHRWLGEVATGGIGSPYTVVVKDVLGDLGETESLDVAVSDSAIEGGVFREFPGKVAAGGSLLSIKFQDAVFPHDFLGSRKLPGAMDPFLEDVTSAFGVVRSGGESISFALDPASIVIAAGAAGAAVAPAIAVTGGEVTLAWDAEVGTTYTIRRSENGRQWEVMATVMADAAAETHVFASAGGAAARFYQVSKDE